MSKYYGDTCTCDIYLMSKRYYKDEETGLRFHEDCDLPRNTTHSEPVVLLKWTWKCGSCEEWFSTSNIWEENDYKYCYLCCDEMGIE